MIRKNFITTYNDMSAEIFPFKWKTLRWRTLKRIRIAHGVICGGIVGCVISTLAAGLLRNVCKDTKRKSVCVYGMCFTAVDYDCDSAKATRSVLCQASSEFIRRTTPPRMH